MKPSDELYYSYQNARENKQSVTEISFSNYMDTWLNNHHQILLEQAKAGQTSHCLKIHRNELRRLLDEPDDEKIKRKVKRYLKNQGFLVKVDADKQLDFNYLSWHWTLIIILAFYLFIAQNLISAIIYGFLINVAISISLAVYEANSLSKYWLIKFDFTELGYQDHQDDDSKDNKDNFDWHNGIETVTQRLALAPWVNDIFVHRASRFAQLLLPLVATNTLDPMATLLKLEQYKYSSKVIQTYVEKWKDNQEMVDFFNSVADFQNSLYKFETEGYFTNNQLTAILEYYDDIIIGLLMDLADEGLIK